MPKKGGQVQKCATFVGPAQVPPILQTGYYLQTHPWPVGTDYIRLGSRRPKLDTFENLRFPIKNAYEKGLSPKMNQGCGASPCTSTFRTGYYVLFSITIAHSNKQIRGQLGRITLGWEAEAQNVTIFENFRFPIENA